MEGYEKQVKAILLKNGWQFFRKGKGSHEIWTNSEGDKVTINHLCKSRFTANAIMKQAGIQHKF